MLSPTSILVISTGMKEGILLGIALTGNLLIFISILPPRFTPIDSPTN
ncbi:MAG: hypothetical protein BWX61_01279 [Bacteroidetes bacterium ADurb.Bin035]|nr:MAG: hypothetical protein BWX61_01279 [Bacteroidetes bacterium ADurb.Bin035]